MRNRNIDFIRGISILLIVVYHVYAISAIYGYAPKVQVPVLFEILMFGGEIGVTLFFILSGYGIYCSLDKDQVQNGRIKCVQFWKKRLARIAPQYYISIGVVLFLTEGASNLSREGIKGILSHCFFIHNFWPDTHGALNGALWTMGVIVQFYLVAVLLYKGIKKNSLICLILSYAITIFTKYLFFHVFGFEQQFVYGRQLITALDNFVLGMVLAKCERSIQSRKKSKVLNWILLFGCLAVFIAFLFVSKHLGVYSDTMIGYTWHSILATILSGIVWTYSRLEINYEFWLLKPFMIISRNEYGIYVWHFLIVNVLLAKSSLVNRIASMSFLLLSILITAITILVGITATKLIDESPFIKRMLIVDKKEEAE